jgi:hypothetical protein
VETPARSRILLVEGVPGIGKSTTIDQMLRDYVAGEAPGRIRTVMTLAQTHTYGPLAAGEDAGLLTREQSIAHLERIVGWIEWLARESLGQHRLKTHVLVDTLHLTHCLRPGVLQWSDAAPFDVRLAASGCKLLLLDAGDDTVRTRTVMARAETEFIRGYALGRFGHDEASLVTHFQRERDRFREMFQRSAMAKRTVAAEAPIEDVTAAATRLWSSNE